MNNRMQSKLIVWLISLCNTMNNWKKVIKGIKMTHCYLSLIFICTFFSCKIFYVVFDNLFLIGHLFLIENC